MMRRVYIHWIYREPGGWEPAWKGYWKTSRSH